MKTMRIAPVLEFVGSFIPGVHELTLLVPAFFGLPSAARALGLDVTLGHEAMAVVSVTFSCLVWIMLNSLAYSRAERSAGITNEVPGGRDSIDRTAETHFKEGVDSVQVKSCHGESSAQEKQTVPAGFP